MHIFTFHSKYLPRPWAMLVALCFVALTVPGSSRAQSQTMVLTVLVRDTLDQPLAGIEVRVIEAASGQPIAEGSTDGEGKLVLPTMPPAVVRVIVSGTLPSGTPVRLLGQDTRGIWVNLPSSAWLMDLRVDTDGTVFPDLGAASAGAVDGAEASALAQPPEPTRSLGRPSSVPLAQLVPTAVGVAVDAEALENSTSPSTTWRVRIALIALVVVIGGFLLVRRGN